MKLERLVKEIRVELSEALIAHKEKAHVRAKACLLHVRNLIDANVKK